MHIHTLADREHYPRNARAVISSNSSSCTCKLLLKASSQTHAFVWQQVKEPRLETATDVCSSRLNLIYILLFLFWGYHALNRRWNGFPVILCTGFRQTFLVFLPGKEKSNTSFKASCWRMHQSCRSNADTRHERRGCQHSSKWTQLPGSPCQRQQSSVFSRRHRDKPSSVFRLGFS